MDAPPSGPLSPQGRWRDALGWAGVLALLVLQYGLFRQCALREVVWAYPGCYDQAAYLGQSYDTYEQILARGPAEGLKYGFKLRTPTGALLHLEAALLFLLLGPGRLSALTLNFLYFALFQLALAGTLRWLTRRWSVALFGVGLLLTALVPFQEMGGALDFRIDFIAFCLFGTFVCAVLRSGVLRSRRWSLAVGATAAWLVLNRSLTAVYVAGMAAPLAVYLLFRVRRAHDLVSRYDAARRLTGLGLAAAVTAAAVLPVFWDRRAGLWNYYVVGHVTGAEILIRARQGAARWLHYPQNLWNDQAGPSFLLLAGLALLLAARAAVLRTRRAAPAGGPRLALAPAFIFLALAVAVPLAALTWDADCSPCVGSILVPGVFGLVLGGLIALAGLHRDGPPRPRLTAALATLAAVGVAAGAWAQLVGYGAARRATRYRQDVEQVHAFFELAHRCCEENGWRAPVFSATANRDYTQHEAHRVWAYERYGTLRQTGAAFGAGIVPLTEEQILGGARASDLLVLVEGQAPPPYPSDRALHAALPRLRAYCEAEMVRLGAFDVEGSELTLYARATLRPEGLAEGWITGAGLRLAGPGAVLRGRSRVVLSGRMGPAAALGPPEVRAELRAGGGSCTVPATFEISPDRQSYRLTVDVRDQDVPADGPVELRLSFEGGFAFVRPGLYCNTRRLVVPAPDRTELLRD